MTARARRRGDDGFTLIELMMVILIIAILLAIAIPTYMSTKRRAQDRAAQTDLRNTMANARTFSVEHQGYYRNDVNPPQPISATDMQIAEGALVFVGPGQAARDRIGVLVDGQPGVYDDGDLDHGRWAIFVTESGSGKFFCIYNDDQTVVRYGQGDAEDEVDEPAECNDTNW